jgi:glycosyltransferase involved in cell wall biosynthesis
VSEPRLPILYLVPRVDLGAYDEIAVDWFKHIDRTRWRASLATTDVSPNRGLRELEPFAEEVWDLPDQMAGAAFPEFILGFIESRGVRLVQIMDSRLGFDLLPDMASLPKPPVVVAQMHPRQPGDAQFTRYVARRYGNLIDAFVATDDQLGGEIASHGIPPSRVETIELIGEAGRDLSGYADLYERLLAERPASSRWRIERDGPAPGEAPGRALPPVRLPRSPRPQPTVSVGVPCFQHGQYLDECIRSIKQQFLKPARIVVVDDGSQDPETLAALERLDADPAVTVLRQGANLGPSAARNRALELFETSYGLWIDADDQLLPGALDSMVATLETAPENVGFVYPHAKHTGNRRDCVEMPAYNLWLLLLNNICPSASLFDLRVFAEAGVRYPEDMVVGHEDWDLILQLAERGIHGVHADGPTFLYRKQGFSRVHAVDYGPHDFHREIEGRHPALYRDRAAVKAEWAPALSIVLLDEADLAWTAKDVEIAARQTCRDFELLAASELGEGGHLVERAGASPDEWLQAALRRARGRWVCVLTGRGRATLGHAPFVEQLLRSFKSQDDVAGVALASAPDLSRHTFSQLSAEERRSARLCGVAFERTPGAWIPRISLSEGTPILDDLALALQGHGTMQWRLLPAPESGLDAGPEETRPEGRSYLDLNYRRHRDRSEVVAGQLISLLDPLLPTLTPGTIRRWEDLPTWFPPDTQPLCRHREIGGEVRIFTNDGNPPPGFELDFNLGVTHVCGLPGAQRLVQRAGTFELSENQDELDEGRGLGYVEEEQLPPCERLEIREMPETGDRVLVAGVDDPLYGMARPLATLGWISPFDVPPGGRLFHSEPWRAATLYRSVDLERGRHAYAVELSEDGGDGTILGSVLAAPAPDLVALRLHEDGRLTSDLARPGRASRDPRAVARWVTASGDADRRWTPPTRARHLLTHWAD